MTALVYSTGTVTATQGQTIVYGTGTQWTTVVPDATLFSISGARAYQIEQIINDTTLALALPFPEVSQVNADYTISQYAAPGSGAPAAGTNSEITAGGVAEVLVTGPVNWCYIINPPNDVSQNIDTAENLYVDPVAAPGATDAGANGTTSILSPGARYSFGPLVAGAVIRGNAATGGHKVTVVTG